MKVSLIGSGNVAFHLARVFNNKGLLQEVISRNELEGRTIASDHQVDFKTLGSPIHPESTHAILAISDDALKSIDSQVEFGERIVAHTSGTISIDCLKSNKHYGSFYPLQTFTKDRTVSFENLPILIDGSSSYVKSSLRDLAEMISTKVDYINDDERKHLHVAAVMVNNFTNHLYALAQEHCRDNNIAFEHLNELIRETAEKAIVSNAKDIRTGPAKRGDESTIEKHLALITDPHLETLYKDFTASIRKMYE